MHPAAGGVKIVSEQGGHNDDDKDPVPRLGAGHVALV
jgi:hypothetical protein